MPDFLIRLAARALGALPVAEPLVPARFDPGVEHVALTPFASTNQPAGASEAITESSNRVFLRQAPVTAPECGFAGFDPPSGDLDDAAHLIRSQHARSTALAVSALPLHSRTSEAADAAPRIADAERASALPHFAEPRLTLINPTLGRDRVPGQQQQQRISASLHAPPIVRINIGRIEVRAELPARVAVPAPERGRTPHVSLEQFLKRAGGGGR